jgi:hypothetical protein
MSIFKNVYGMPIHIPFGDFNPSTEFHYDPAGKGLVINDEEHGQFTHEVFEKILDKWKSFNENYRYDENVYHWFEREHDQ